MKKGRRTRAEILRQKGWEDISPTAEGAKILHRRLEQEISPLLSVQQEFAEAGFSLSFYFSLKRVRAQ